jgi:hypothetical protein
MYVKCWRQIWKRCTYDCVIVYSIALLGIAVRSSISVFRIPIVIVARFSLFLSNRSYPIRIGERHSLFHCEEEPVPER